MSQIFGNQNKSYLEKIARQGANAPKAFSAQTLTVAGTAVSLTVPDGTIYCDITLESTVTTGVVVRYFLLGDKTLPTSTVGIPLQHLTRFDIFDYQNIISFRAIESTVGTHTLTIQYYK